MEELQADIDESFVLALAKEDISCGYWACEKCTTQNFELSLATVVQECSA